MVEVLLAIFILGVGLIMVACIFPVGADWTRQNAEETVAGVIAKNAVALIQAKYTLADLQVNPATNYVAGTVVYDPNSGLYRCAGGLGGGGGAGVSMAPLTAFGLTGVQKLPLMERAYAFGSSSPYSAANPAGANYFWQAMVRPTPGQPRRFDVFIFVMKKGAPEQTFTDNGTVLNSVLAADTNAVPYLATGTPPVGSMGLGMTSGTSFRQLPGGVQKPALMAAGETTIYAPPPDGGSTVSPLVYIYQTAIGF